ncbi:MAG: hypothetical protein U0992_02160 [Planctomycetaceae bacterium]
MTPPPTAEATSTARAPALDVHTATGTTGETDSPSLLAGSATPVVAISLLAAMHFLVDTAAGTINPLWQGFEERFGVRSGGLLWVYVCWQAASSSLAIAVRLVGGLCATAVADLGRTLHGRRLHGVDWSGRRILLCWLCCLSLRGWGLPPFTRRGRRAAGRRCRAFAPQPDDVDFRPVGLSRAVARTVRVRHDYDEVRF